MAIIITSSPGRLSIETENSTDRENLGAVFVDIPANYRPTFQKLNSTFLEIEVVDGFSVKLDPSFDIQGFAGTTVQDLRTFINNL